MMLTGLAFLLAAAGPCNRDPAIVKLADTNVPKAYYAQLSGTRVATVAVTLDASGKVTDAHIYESTGDATLDNAAVDAAKRSTFTAAETGCARSGSTFGVEFQFVGEKPGAAGLDCPHDATVIKAAVIQPSYWPPIPGDVQVAVLLTIGPTGKLMSAKIAQSSNSMALDEAALASVRASTFAPKTVALPVRRQAGAGQSESDGFVCKPVSGDYLFRITYRRP